MVSPIAMEVGAVLGVASLCIGLRVSGFCPKVHVQGPGVLWGSLAQRLQWPLQCRGLVVE